MATKKIQKLGGAEPTEFEINVAQTLNDLQQSTTAKDIAPTLKDLWITAAREVDVSGGKKAIVIYVPFPQLKLYHKIQVKVVRELEKKFAGKHVLIVAHRTMQGEGHSRTKGAAKGPRPRSRTLTAIQESVLEDIVYPTEIVGKRTRCKIDGTKTLKVLLDPKEKVNVEGKLETFASVYNKLTAKTVQFVF